VKILNLYAGIGGNRKLWEGHEITAVELDPQIAKVYKQFFPDDEVVVADAHQYLLDHYSEFDFIWSSPPCPTHSKLVTAKRGWGIYEYPDMKLYQEIIFLKHTFKGKWVVENVEPFYGVLLLPSMVLGRHFFWSNFLIPKTSDQKPHKGNLSHNRKEELSEGLDIKLPEGTKDQRKLLRNAVDPRIGLHILKAAEKVTKQEVLF
jgi:DNA (cytosine-5)-methyltransferase 1